MPLPARRRQTSRVARRWLPSSRSLAVGFILLAAGIGAYLIARETSVFALQRIDVEGAPPALALRIRSALAPLRGASLVAFSRSSADHRLAGFPQIAHVRYDRDFPHTLRVSVSVEEPVAVLRRGADAWVVAAGGRVIATVPRGAYPALPRLWLAAETDVAVGGSVRVGDALQVAAALRADRFAPHVLSLHAEGKGQLALELTSGREVRLGDLSNLAVKLAVATAVLPRAPGAAYVDVSVPSRAVAGYSTSPPADNAQVSGQG